MTKINTTWHTVLPEVIQLVHRVLLYGPPDTGKTTSACRLGDDQARQRYAEMVVQGREVDRDKFIQDHGAIRLQCSRQQGIEDLLGSFVLREGKTEFVAGPIPKAMRQGRILVVDEFDQRNSAHDSIYHALLDDLAIACVSLPDGSECRPVDGFKVICTTNATPGAFSPALQRRFELKLWCGSSHPEALKTLLPECASLLVNWQQAITRPDCKVETSISSLRVFATLSAKFGQDKAAALVFPSTSQEFLSTLANNIKA